MIKEKNNKEVFDLSDTLKLLLTGPENQLPADSVNWLLSSDVFSSSEKEINIPAKKLGLGVHKISALAWQDGKKFNPSVEMTILSDTAPQKYICKVLATYPHDTSAYTQGLFFENGFLYESTGRKGESSLRRVHITGELSRFIALPDSVFGEGISAIGGNIYLLTWMKNKGYVYDKKTFELKRTFSYPQKMDGWGLSTDGKHLILSDGSNHIYWLNPQDSMQIVRGIEVYDNETAIKYLNELEYVDGLIYANIYGKDTIVSIDASTGKVLSTIDCSSLLSEKDKYPGFKGYNYVLNGIAHNPKNGHFYLTGKKWPKLFEVRFVKTDSLASAKQ